MGKTSNAFDLIHISICILVLIIITIYFYASLPCLSTLVLLHWIFYLENFIWNLKALHLFYFYEALIFVTVFFTVYKPVFIPKSSFNYTSLITIIWYFAKCAAFRIVFCISIDIWLKLVKIRLITFLLFILKDECMYLFGGRGSFESS